MSQEFIALGIFLIFVGFILVFIGALGEAKETKFAVGGFVGPFPFGFASDPGMLRIILAISVGMFLLLLIARYFT